MIKITMTDKFQTVRDAHMTPLRRELQDVESRNVITRSGVGPAYSAWRESPGDETRRAARAELSTQIRSELAALGSMSDNEVDALPMPRSLGACPEAEVIRWLGVRGLQVRWEREEFQDLVPYGGGGMTGYVVRDTTTGHRLSRDDQVRRVGSVIDDQVRRSAAGPGTDVFGRPWH